MRSDPAQAGPGTSNKNSNQFKLFCVYSISRLPDPTHKQPKDMATNIADRMAQIVKRQTAFANYGRYADECLRNTFDNLERQGGYALDALATHIHFKHIHVNDFRDEGGNTMLHRVAKCGLPDSVLELLAMGADPTILNHDGKKPLDIACTRVDLRNSRCNIQKFEHERFDVPLNVHSLEIYDHFFTCQDPAYPVYAEITELLKAAELMLTITPAQP